MDAIEALKTRRSVRRYEDRPIPRAVLEDIVDCGRLAATATNIQPWEFVVVTDKAKLAELAGATDHGRFIADAAACVVVLSTDTKYYLEDGSAATQNVLLGARAHGLGSCWVAGDKKAYADVVLEMLSCPDGLKLVSLIPLGYPAEAPDKSKRALSDVLHWETYSNCTTSGRSSPHAGRRAALSRRLLGPHAMRSVITALFGVVSRYVRPKARRRS